MRVLTLASEFPPAHGYGLGRYVADHTAALAAGGCEVAVACNNWDANLQSGRYDREGVEVNNAPIFMPIKGYSWVADVLQSNLLLETRALKMSRRDGEFDILQVHDWLTASAAHCLHDLLDLPLVVTIHDTVRGRNQGELNPDEQYVASMETWICQQADAVLCNSAFIHKELVEAYGVDEEKITVVGCGVDPQAFKSDTPPRLFRSVLGAADVPMIIFVGRLTAIKGPQVLLEAVPEVLRVVPEARFVFAGDGQMQQSLTQRAGQLGVAEKVRFVGHLRGTVLATLYHSADATIVPSLYEPFGMVALESVVCGTPIIASETGGLLEIMSKADCALPIPPKDSSALARAIVYLLRHPDRAAELAENGRRVALEQYGWDRVAQKTLSAYNRVVG